MLSIFLHFLMPLLLAFAAQLPERLNMHAPELVGGPWINTPGEKPIKLADLRGKVIIVHFWTFDCINCKNNLPVYSRWEKRFADVSDVALISIHTPELPQERQIS